MSTDMPSSPDGDHTFRWVGGEGGGGGVQKVKHKYWDDTGIVSGLYRVCSPNALGSLEIYYSCPYKL